MYKLEKSSLKGMLDKLLYKAHNDSDVLAVVLFGSAAREEPARDVDMCLVLFPDKDSKGFEKRLEYSSSEDVDVHVFRDLPLYIRVRVLRDGRVLHCKDEGLLYDIASSTVREFEYFRPRYEDYLEGVLDG